MSFLKKHLSVVVVSTVVASLVAAGPVIAHGVNHALFAHDSGKLDGKDSKSFVQRKSPILVTVPPGQWKPTGYSQTVESILNEYTHVTARNSTATNGDMEMSPILPTTLYGKRLRLKGVEICVDATDPGVAYTYLELKVFENSDDGLWTEIDTDSPTDGGQSFSHNDKTCHDYPFTSPPMLGPGGADGLYILLNGTWSTPDAPLNVGRVTLILQPTNQTGVAPF